MNGYRRKACRGLNRGDLSILALLLAVCLFTGCAVRRAGMRQARAVELEAEDYRLVWPLPIVTTSRITSYFGSRQDPLNETQSFHTGVDIDGEQGTPVHAAGAGRVEFSAARSGYGLLLIIDHGRGLTTYYGHCSKLFIKRGQKVNRGQVIARMGATGHASGTHLHFEARKFGQPLDPFSLLPKLRKL